MLKKYIKSRVSRVSAPSRREYEDIVQNGLAVTPSEMMQMTARGIPVTTNNLGLVYEDGVSSLDYTPPLEYTRGIDIADLWERRQDIREKFGKKYREVLSDAAEVKS